MADYVKESSGAAGGVLVLHAWWGLNDVQKEICNRLAAKGFTALGPDLYEGQVARTIPEAKRLRGNLNQNVVSRHILQCLAQLQSMVRNRLVAVMGFSMGAFQAMRLVELKPRSLELAVLFYGARGGSYSGCQTTFLGHFAAHDQFQSKSGWQRLEKTLKRAGRDVTFYEYPATSHWFFERDRPEFDRAAADLAWHRTIAQLMKTVDQNEPQRGIRSDNTSS